MSAIPTGSVLPLLVAAAAVVLGCAAWLAIHRLRGQLLALRRELAEHHTQTAGAAGTSARLPGARTASDGEEIRAAVAAALADERERELAEARAYWAAHDLREPQEPPVLDGTDSTGGLEGPGGPTGTADHSGTAGRARGFEALPFLPRQADPADGEPEAAAPPRSRDHPSDPGFTPASTVAGPERTLARLAELATARTPLADVRPGPLGTLDLYVFTDGTTLCLTPGQRETADRLAAAVTRGEAPVLLGGSGVSGGYALTFTYGAESVFVLADRVVASL